jgi:predicted Zn-dependent protease
MDVAAHDNETPGPDAGPGTQDGPYDWYQGSLRLLAAGDSDDAAALLERLRVVEPGSTAVLEALARAWFDGHRYAAAAECFGELVERCPADDYAHFGFGLSLWRLQRFPEARDQLAMAFVMRPDRPEYGQALTQVKATLRARALDGLPLEGPISR